MRVNNLVHGFVGVVVVLSVCGSVQANEAQKRIQKMSEKDRRALFTFTMKDEKCGTVTRTFYQGAVSGDAFWNVTCTNGRSYVVEVMDDAEGSTKILECDVIKAVGGTPCSHYSGAGGDSVASKYS